MAFGSQPWMYASGEAYTIDNSLRFDRGGSPTLTKTFGSAGDRKTYTWSGWIKLGSNFSTNRYIFAANSYNDALLVGSDQELYFNQGDPPESVIRSENRLRDPSAWYHILVAVDTTVSSPSSDRIKLYINGDRVTDFIQETYPSEDYEGNINNAIAHTISGYPSSNYFDGYLAEVYFIDGTALGPESFGETDTATNQWKPIDASDLTFGTNGFYQKYSATELAASFEDAVKYTVTSFTTVESTTWTAPAGVTSVEYLVVAGGGSGANSAGAWGGGGGGAGGLRTGTLSVTPSSSYTVTVGDGGTAVASAGNGVNGSDSVFSSITSTGGGGGGNGNGLVGGSGGGAGGTGGSNTGAAGTAGQGYAGGSNAGGGCTYGTYGGAGGGGSSAVGGSSGAGLRVGGAGTASSITGASVTYAGGGGGGITNAGSCTGGAGGSGGGGAGGTNGAGTNATGYGSGGGGNGDGGGDSGTGSSGIVIIRYVDSSGAVSGHTITANGDVTNSRAQSKVGDSSIYFDGTGDYLSVPDSDDFDFTSAFTIEFWFRTSDSTTTQAFYVKRASEIASNIRIGVGSVSGKLEVLVSSGTSSWDIWLNQSVADISNDTWYHVALTWDGSTYTIWLDGVSQDTSTDSNYPTVNTASVYLGARQDGTQAIDGYLDEIRISDTARYTSSFTPSTTAFTADSNTMLLIHSDFDGGLGADSSGNKNDFAPTNLVATDQMVDSPTNNWCTMNPLAKSATAMTFSEGNLEVIGNDDWQMTVGTMSMSSGKWYCELLCGGTNTKFGIAIDKVNVSTKQELSILYHAGGQKVIDSVWSNYGDSFTTGDIIGYAIDMDGSTITFYINNVSQGAIAFSGSVSTAQSIIFGGALHTNKGNFNFGQDSSFAGNKTAQGNQDENDKGDFYYAPPSGYLALCTDNLPSPEIADPTDHFNTVLYTGTGAAQSISNVNFQPDWVWIKKRNATQSHDLFDSVRGVHKVLGSDHTNAEGDNSEMLTSFDSDGFTIGDDSEVNSNTNTFVSWNWKAGGTAVSNTDGSITSSVSANTTAGFSIVSYTSPGTDVDETVGHGLSQAPEMVIVKNLDSTFNWDVWTPALASEKDLILNSDDDELSSRWSATVPSASLVTLRDSYEVNGTDDYIAYCFHSVEGYSKVGSYVGNGVADGTFVYTGFRPAFVILKKYNVSGKGWYMFDNKRDTYNGMSGSIAANASGDESTTEVRLDFVSNGIKFRIGDSGYNDGNFIYIAFAESPFKTSNAR